MTKQQFIFAFFLVLAILCAVFALLAAAPNLPVDRNFLALIGALFLIIAVQNA